MKTTNAENELRVEASPEKHFQNDDDDECKQLIDNAANGIATDANYDELHDEVDAASSCAQMDVDGDAAASMHKNKTIPLTVSAESIVQSDDNVVATWTRM